MRCVWLLGFILHYGGMFFFSFWDVSFVVVDFHHGCNGDNKKNNLGEGNCQKFALRCWWRGLCPSYFLPSFTPVFSVSVSWRFYLLLLFLSCRSIICIGAERENCDAWKREMVAILFFYLALFLFTLEGRYLDTSIKRASWVLSSGGLDTTCIYTTFCLWLEQVEDLAGRGVLFWGIQNLGLPSWGLNDFQLLFSCEKSDRDSIIIVQCCAHGWKASLQQIKEGVVISATRNL